MIRLLGLTLVACGLRGSALAAQPLFASDAPVTVTLTTNLRELIRERDSTKVEWHDASMQWTEADGSVQTMTVQLRARGHFRRQSQNCTFPPVYVRAAREDRDGTLLQGNPRVKLVTPCRTNSGDYQQYIFTEYLTYRTYQIIDPVHHRTRLANVTYVDSAGRMKPIAVTAFFLETGEEVADEAKLTHSERTGVTWDFIPREVIDRISLFEYWIANTDWSVAGLHNIVMLQLSELEYRPVAYDFDWSGLVNTRYSRPNTTLGLTSTRQRLHRGPCRTVAEWAPTVAHFREKRAEIDALWSTPLAGQDPKKLEAGKKFLDELWPILDDPRRFQREIIEKCQKEGN
jgi:hypothetical protein